MNTEEFDKIAINTQTLGVGSIRCPRTFIEPKHAVEVPRWDSPRDRTLLVEELRHLQTQKPNFHIFIFNFVFHQLTTKCSMKWMSYLIEGEDVRSVAGAIALVAFDVTGNTADGSETWHRELLFLGFVEKNQTFFPFAELEPEI